MQYYLNVIVNWHYLQLRSFRQTEEDIQTDMYKVLEQLTAHDDAWPFLDPVEEEYAPNYYAVIRRPMDLNKMEERLDNGYYADFEMFKSDFKLIVNNCRLYNGQDNGKIFNLLIVSFIFILCLTFVYIYRVYDHGRQFTSSIRSSH